VLPHREAATEAMGQLRRGGLCAFLVDHNCKSAEAQFLPFLGKTAAVNKGPAILALRAKAEVWPFFLIRLPQGRFRAVTCPVWTRRPGGQQDGAHRADLPFLY
jgi:Lauroyl/myristoyl acyltransferase